MLIPEWNELVAIADCLAVAPYLVAWLSGKYGEEETSCDH